MFCNSYVVKTILEEKKARLSRKKTGEDVQGPVPFVIALSTSPKRDNNTMGPPSSVEDCWSCRLIGSGVFLGTSAYFWSQRGRYTKAVQRTDRRVVTGLAAIAGFLGGVRLLVPVEYIQYALGEGGASAR